MMMSPPNATINHEASQYVIAASTFFPNLTYCPLTDEYARTVPLVLHSMS
jgi:hypothetical protein